MGARAIDAAQVAVATIILVTTAALFYVPGPAAQLAGRDAWLSLALASLLAAALARAVARLYFLPGREPGGRPTWPSRLGALAFGCYATYLAVLGLAQVSTVMTTVLPEMPIGVFAGGTALSGFWLAIHGREALFRSGQLLFPLMVVASLVNLGFSLAGNVDPRELLPVLELGPGPVLAAVPVAFAFASELAALIWVAAAVRDPHRLLGALPLASLVSGALLVAYTAASITVLGTHEVARSTLPVLALTRQVRVSLFLSRVEILTLFAWLTGAFVKEGLLLAAASHSLGRALGLPDRWRGVTVGAVAAVTGFLGVLAFPNALRLFAHLRGTFPAVAVAATVAILAAGLLGRPPRARAGPRGRRRIPGAAACLIAALLTSGCYGRVEPEQAAVVTVLGIDRAPSGRVAITVEVVGAPIGGTRQEGVGGMAQRLLRAEGRSLLDAQRHLELSAAREVLWSHVNVVVVGEELARSGLWPVLDPLTRRYTFRRNAFLFAAPGRAADLMERLRPAFNAPRFSAFQRAILRPSGRVGPTVDLNAFLRTLGREGEDPVLPVVEAHPPASAEPMLQRAALFRRDRLVAILDDPATLGLYWLTGQQEVERLRWPCPYRRGVRGLGVTAVRSQSSRRAEAADGEPRARARIRIEADVEEWQCPATVSPEALVAAEGAASAWVEREVRRLLDLARSLQVDPAGFGAALHRSDPAAWAALRDRWRDELRDLPVELTVVVKLRRTGLTLSPP